MVQETQGRQRSQPKQSLDFGLMARIPESTQHKDQEWEEIVQLDRMLSKERKMQGYKPLQEKQDLLYAKFVDKVRQSPGGLRQSSSAVGGLLGVPSF